MSDVRGCRVSVVMLTYNQSQYIDAAIQSVMHQNTDFDFELIIGDDCSTDDTLDRCKRWQQRYGDERIVILPAQEHNLGIQANYLRAFAVCRGEYIAICEGDDYWIDREKLRLQVEFLDSNRDYALCVHRVVNYYQNDGSKSLSNGGQKSENDILDLAKSNFISNVSAMWRRGQAGDALSRVLDPKENNQTVDYVTHMLNAQYGKIHYMNRCMAVYRKHNSAVWSQVGADRQYLMAMNVRRALMNYYKDVREDVYGLLQDAYMNNAIALMRYYQTTPGASDKCLDVRTEIKRVIPTADDAEIDRRLAAASVSRKSLKKTLMLILKTGRKIVSRFVPVPKPC